MAVEAEENYSRLTNIYSVRYRSDWWGSLELVREIRYQSEIFNHFMFIVAHTNRNRLHSLRHETWCSGKWFVNSDAILRLISNEWKVCRIRKDSISVSSGPSTRYRRGIDRSNKILGFRGVIQHYNRVQNGWIWRNSEHAFPYIVSLHLFIAHLQHKLHIRGFYKLRGSGNRCILLFPASEWNA